MSFFSSLFGSLPWDTPWDLDAVALPWGDRPSIYGHVRTHARTEGPGLLAGGADLPDEARVRKDGQLSWAPGALDGVFGHHAGVGAAEDIAARVLAALRAVLERSTDDRVEALYGQVTAHGTLEYVDTLLPLLAAKPNLHVERLHAVGRWLATQAPDREPVKLGIALLGIVQGVDDRDLLLILGRHEEFTLYCAVSLTNQVPRPDHVLLSLARLVTGWGRVHLVERLAETTSDEVRAWMLREGYRNDIMWEYTALVCARTGGLLEALRLPEPDDALVFGAGDILSTLLRGGGPAEGIESYPEGAEATELYLGHLRSRDEVPLDQFLHLHAIRRFLAEEDGEVHDPALGWPIRRTRLVELVEVILNRPDWEPAVRVGLQRPDRESFWTAAEAAKLLGLDPWEHYFERTARGEDYWWNLMQTDDAERAARVVALAEARLPLSAIATGPRDELGVGPGFAPHMALDWVLDGLRRFPGVGGRLLLVGLRSPVTRNRNMALRALGGWTRASWPAGAEATLRLVVTEEPNADTEALARRVLQGESLEDEG
jgi:hypothetical protein